MTRGQRRGRAGRPSRGTSPPPGRTSRRACELARAAGARHEESRASSNLGVLAVYAGDDEEAIRRYEHAAAIARELGDERTLALLLQNLGLVHAGTGPPRARRRAARGEPRGRRAVAAIPRSSQSIQRGLARLLIDEDPTRARAVLRETLGGSHAMADIHGTIHCLETAAALAADPLTGARLWGAAGALRAAAGGARQPDEAAFAERVEATLRDAVGPAVFTERRRRGRGAVAGRRRRAGLT